MIAEPLLPLVWAGIIGVSVALYVILDGFDLGLGMLFPFAAEESERDQMMASIAPFWDGNETWLVMGGVGLMVAFPAAYAVLLPAMYLPVILMLLALVFRGIAFEFRELGRNRRRWNVAFSAGSLVAGLSQGVILGGLIQGIAIRNTEYGGGPLDFATPFALLCGLGVAVGYALLGATWLVMKTSGPLAERARRWGVILLVAVLALMGVVSLWTALAFPDIRARWFSWPNLLLLSPVPILTAIAGLLCWRTLQTDADRVPFVAAIALFLLGFLGLAVSRFPYLVPPSLTIWEAASSPSSQAFMLAGAVVLLPMTLGYTVYVYWLFRGKIGPGESYH